MHTDTHPTMLAKLFSSTAVTVVCTQVTAIECVLEASLC